MAQSQLVANGTSDASGNVTITFPTTHVNAEFTGTISVPGAPATSQWTIFINDTAVAVNGGNNSAGPFQLNSSDVMVLKGINMAAVSQYQAVLIGALVYGTSGTVIPIPTASSLAANISGPVTVEGAAGSPLDVIGYGGLQGAGITLPATPGIFIPAPGVGFSLRLHRIVWLQTGVPGSANQYYALCPVGAAVFYSVFCITYDTSKLYSLNDNLNGQLVPENTGVSFINSTGAFPNTSAWLTYDTVTTPVIT